MGKAIGRQPATGNNIVVKSILLRYCCCCSKVLRRHMAHRPSTSFMSVLYNLAKWLFLYSVYFSSLFFFIFSHFFIFFFGPQALFFSHVYVFFALQLFFSISTSHAQLFAIEVLRYRGASTYLL